jgi:hypothetical protein
MYVWELVAYRLRSQGWDIWHAEARAGDETEFVVHFRRPGVSGRVDGPTLTEAYAEAARQVRAYPPMAQHKANPLVALVG